MRRLAILYLFLFLSGGLFAQDFSALSALEQEGDARLWRGEVLTLQQLKDGIAVGALSTPIAYNSFALFWQAAPGFEPSSFRVQYRVHQTGKGWRAWAEEEGAFAPDEHALNLYGSDLLFGFNEEAHDSIEFRILAPRGGHLGQVQLVLQYMPEQAGRPLAERKSSSAGCPAQPTLLPRADWCGSFGACHNPTYTPTYLITTTHTIIHHGAAPDTYTSGHSVVRSYWNYHVNTLGWSDIGYNYLFDRFGNSFIGRQNPNFPQQEVRGAHAGNSNSRSIGLSFLGNAELAVNVPTIALERCTEFLAWWYERRSIDPRSSANIINQPGTQTLNLPRICGHRDVNATACPGTILYAHLPSFAQDAWAIIEDCQQPQAPSISLGQLACPNGSGSLVVQASSAMQQVFELCNSSGVVLQSWTGNAAQRSFTGLSIGQYRARIVRNGQSSPLSPIFYLDGGAASQLGQLVGGAQGQLCLGESTGLLSLQGSHNGQLSWERRQGQQAWQSLGNQGTSYQESPTTAGIWSYRLRAEAAPCPVVYSNSRSIDIGSLPIGSSCACPKDIQLPLVNYQDHTQAYGNMHSPSDVSPIFEGIEANEMVFRFETTVQGQINTTLDLSAIWGSVLVTANCPDAQNPLPFINSLTEWEGGSFSTSLAPGTYYLLVSSPSIWTASMPFTLNIDFGSHSTRDEPTTGGGGSTVGSGTRTGGFFTAIFRFIFSLFPNPANNFLRIEGNSEFASVRLFDLSGKLLLERRDINNLQLELDVSHLPAGQYYIQAEDKSGQQATESLIIRH